MALPSSGPLSLNDIRIELGASATNQSLRSFSSTAGFSTPDAVSEFYGYSSLTSIPYNAIGDDSRSGASNVCGLETTPNTAYHNGSGAAPTVGDMIYSDSAGTTPLLVGYFYKFTYQGSKYLRISTTTAGLVGVVNSC